MASAGVIQQEIDLSTRVPSFPGVYGAIAIPAKKGERNIPFLVTNETQLLKQFTPNERIEVGYDLAYFSALAYLQKSNKLWVIRAMNSDALYGGVTVRVNGAPTANSAVATGISDPNAYSFDATVSDEECLLIHGSNQGFWNNDIYIKLTTYTTDPDYVKEVDAFIIDVFKTDDLNNPIESHLCSRKQGHKDGFNRNIYVEDVLSRSDYIRAVDNLAIAETIQPKDQITTLQVDKGTDGSAVTDADMINAINSVSNPDNYLLTLVLDGGWATAAYQSNLITLCEIRKDCMAILSTPYSDEASATYMTDIVAYRKTTLNANTSYACLTTAHVKIYDKFNDRNLYVSPDGYVAAAISETASNREIWFPAAGFRRGIFNVLDVRRRFTKGEMDQLYDNGINPIRFVPGRGILLWGNKTLLSRPSSLDRMNVRLLLVTIEPAITEALEDFVFELHDTATYTAIDTLIRSALEGIKARRGLIDYAVIVDSSNNSQADIDANRLNCWVFVRPAKSVEFIRFKTIITRTGTSFEQASAAV